MSRRELGNKTGLSMNTLRSFWMDTWGGINRETMDKLCAALEIAPADLFVYEPEDQK